MTTGAATLVSGKIFQPGGRLVSSFLSSRDKGRGKILRRVAGFQIRSGHILPPGLA